MAIEPEVDLSGYWVDGDVVRIGSVRVGAGGRVGSRSTLMPGARVGKGVKIAAGSTVTGPVRADQRSTGGSAWPAHRPPRTSRSFWVGAYSLTAQLLGLVPVVAALPALALIGWAVADRPTLGAALAPSRWRRSPTSWSTRCRCCWPSACQHRAAGRLPPRPGPGGLAGVDGPSA